MLTRVRLNECFNAFYLTPQHFTLFIIQDWSLVEDIIVFVLQEFAITIRIFIQYTICSEMYKISSIFIAHFLARILMLCKQFEKSPVWLTENTCMVLWEYIIDEHKSCKIYYHSIRSRQRLILYQHIIIIIIASTVNVMISWW